MDSHRGGFFVGFYRVICCNDLRLCWTAGAWAPASLPPFYTYESTVFCHQHSGRAIGQKEPTHYMVTGITRTQYRLKTWKSRITHKSLLGRLLTTNQDIKSLICAWNLHNWAKYALKNLKKWQKPPRYSGGGAKSPSLIANLSLFQQFAIVDSYMLFEAFWMSFQMSIVSICSAKLHPDFFNQTCVFLMILLLKSKILPQSRGIT